MLRKTGRKVEEKYQGSANLLTVRSRGCYNRYGGSFLGEFALFWGVRGDPPKKAPNLGPGIPMKMGIPQKVPRGSGRSPRIGTSRIPKKDPLGNPHSHGDSGIRIGDLPSGGPPGPPKKRQFPPKKTPHTYYSTSLYV